MAAIKTKINPNSAEFSANAAAMQAQVDDLQATLDKIREGGGSKACERHVSRGKLLPRERVQGLLDPGSPFLELSALAAHDVYGEDVPAAGIITGIGRVSGQECVIVANDATVAVITQGLRDLGLLDGEVAELIETEAYREFYMHSSGHWLGMDVHDVGDYKIENQWRVYEPGMVVTVEPGIYISPDNTAVAEKWRGMAVRIEDDIAVTKTGHEDLTSGVPKTRGDIELLMAS